MGCHQLHAVGGCGIEHLPAFGCRKRQRLFHEDMLAGVRSIETSLEMQPVRERADHDIDVVALERGVVVGHKLDFRVLVLPSNGGFRPLLRYEFEFGTGRLVHYVNIRTADTPCSKYRYADHLLTHFQFFILFSRRVHRASSTAQCADSG